MCLAITRLVQIVPTTTTSLRAVVVIPILAVRDTEQKTTLAELTIMEVVRLLTKEAEVPSIITTLAETRLMFPRDTK